MSETKINDLRINKGLTKQQLIESTTITENELSFVTDDSIVDVPAPTEAGKVLTSTEDGVEWAEGGSGGSSYTAGNGISIDANNEISVTVPTLQNGGTGADALAINTTGRFNATVAIGNGAGSGGGKYWLQDVLIGNNADCTCAGAIAIGYGAKAGNSSDVGEGSIAIGRGATVTTGRSPRASGIAIGKSAQAIEAAIQIGSGTNNDVDTVKIANRNGNFELMSADGTIPAERLANTIGNINALLDSINGEVA